MIDLNHGSGANQGRQQIGPAIVALVDDALARLNAERSRRTYLGASQLGTECERQIQLDYIEANGLNAPTPDNDGPKGLTLRIFDMGHQFEALTIKWLKAAGFKLRTEDEEGFQFGFSVAGGRFRGHVDGVLISGPDCLKYPALWEHKALGQKSWQDVAKKGVRISKPQYAAQIALYQAYLDLTENPALFTAVNRDNGELYHELMPFNGELAQNTSDKAVRILQATDAGELLPRAFASSDFYQCRFCRWHGFCWKK